MKEDILIRNQETLPMVYASCAYGINGYGKANYKKQLSFLVLTDLHGSAARLESAVHYLNTVPSLDFGIHLGDMQPSNFAQNDGSWYTNEVKKAEKPFFTVMGNHDGGTAREAKISGTRQQVYDKFLAPVSDKVDPECPPKTTYYSKNFDAYKVSIIVLDNYEQPEERDENGDFIFHRGIEALSQAQLDWFVEALQKVPAGYHLLIARHASPDEGLEFDCPFTQPGRKISYETAGYAYNGQNMIPRIVDAWVNGGEIDAEFVSKKPEGLPTLRVKASFAARGEGVFVGYFVGHNHSDAVGVIRDYPKQHIYVFPTASDDWWQNYHGDLPRCPDTKQQDCVTVCSIDTEKRLVKLVRVGSDVTTELTLRKCYLGKY